MKLKKKKYGTWFYESQLWLFAPVCIKRTHALAKHSVSRQEKLLQDHHGVILQADSQVSASVLKNTDWHITYMQCELIPMISLSYRVQV